MTSIINEEFSVSVIPVFQEAAPAGIQLQEIPSTVLFMRSLYLLEGPFGLTELLHKKSSELFPEEQMLIQHLLSRLFEISFHLKLSFYVIEILLLVYLA